MTIIGISAGASLAVAAAGLVLLRALRRRSLLLSVIALAAVSVGTVLAGALAAGAVMFLSTHDLHVLLVVVAVAGPVGMGTALLLGHRAVRAVERWSTQPPGSPTAVTEAPPSP